MGATAGRTHRPTRGLGSRGTPHPTRSSWGWVRVASRGELAVVNKATLVVVIGTDLLTTYHVFVLMTADSCFHTLKVDKSRESSRRVLLGQLLDSLYPPPFRKVVLDFRLAHVVWKVPYPQMFASVLPRNNSVVTL